MQQKTAPLCVTVIADLHHFSARLGSSGRAYELRSMSDQKCLAETGAIIDAAFEEIGNDPKTEAVLIAGDLTNNGEMWSHEEMLEKLARLRKKKPVYVITATHDWGSNHINRRFEEDRVLFDDIEVAPEDELMQMYAAYGYEQAISLHRTAAGNASYVAQLKPGYRLLALNDDHNGKGRAGYDDAHLAWILEQIAQARRDGDTLIAMTHHLVLEHAGKLTTNAQCIGDRAEMAETLAAAGLEFLFTGHSHMQHIAQYAAKNGNRLVDINVGALTGYPAPIVRFTIDTEQAVVSTRRLERFLYHGQSCGTDYLRDKAAGLLMHLINSAADGPKSRFLELADSFGIRGKAVARFYSIIRFAAGKFRGLRVDTVRKILNGLTFGKAVDKETARQVGNERVLEIAVNLFLAILDGERKYPLGSPMSCAVKQAVATPRRILRHLPLPTKKLEGTLHDVEELVNALVDIPGPDNNHMVWKRPRVGSEAAQVS